MNKKFVASCPICQEEGLKKMVTCQDYFVSNEHFDLYECKNCGFIQTANAPSENEIGKYYQSESYISHSNTNKGLMNKVYHLVRNYMINKKTSLAQKSTGLTSGTALDVGAGIGLFANEMRAKGWDIQAIEPSQEAQQRAKELYNLDLKGHDLWQKLPNQSQDLITLWHVLEHLPQLNESWADFYSVLKPTGTLIIAVPNADSYDAKYYGSDWAAYDVPRHLWHFKPKTMQQLAKKHGFKINKIIPMPFDGFYISMMTEKNLNHSFSFLRGAWVGFKGYISALKNKEKSSSLIYVLQKI